ncbi:MAG: leucyl/phenylalanyl-tRNA--protein transferase [Verrucomicrobiota bacterium]|nr:leucyl/phenylalanyl-tRNA--protein transferase [Limisphaera sp.]MDW8380972.1 leucyl/phenylalanyl-tRNA--protein transferase [Verrucomicrobiota bacterium]
MRASPTLPALLGQRLWFPDPRLADSEGLVAIGGDFSPARLLLAYRSGIFPWTDNPITWWSPDPRAIFDFDRVHVPRSLRRVLRKQRFTLTRDRAFRQVMEGCAEPAPGREESWVTPAFIHAYTVLHRMGYAHSVEVWEGNDLVGGVYGVAIGGFFAGESMFHRRTDASKVALVHLLEHLRQQGYALFDTQMLTPVTRLLGAVEISREEYLRRLALAIEKPCHFAAASP